MAAVRELQPDLAPRVRLGWGSINFRHPQAGFVCAVFPMPDHVSLVFEHGRQLSSPLLQGTGRQVRFIRFEPGDPVPRDELAALESRSTLKDELLTAINSVLQRGAVEYLYFTQYVLQ